MGNLRSVSRALDRLGAQHRIQTDVAGADKLIIPGVGAFGAAMEKIGPHSEAIREFVQAGKPLLGICLGQQLLFDRSEELGVHKGLGLVPGRVRYLRRQPGLKIPHMGWSSISPVDGRIFSKGVAEGDQVYFVHSLVTECREEADVAAWAEHGERFAAMIEHENVWGTQFHPEKSGPIGLRILERFVKC